MNASQNSFKKNRIVLLCSPKSSFIFILSLFILSGCNQFDPRLNPKASKAPLAKEKVADANIHQFQTSSYEENTLKWHIQSDLAEVFNSQERTYLSKVNLTFYDTNRQPTSFVIADRAILLTDTQDIELLDNVNIRNAKGTALYGSYFYWNNTTEELTSPKEVVLRKRNGFTISGTGFSTDKSIETIHFKSQVSGEVVEEGASEKDFFNVEF